jgi:CRISPR-associated protein Csm3
MTLTLLGYQKVEGTIKCLTGLHIGGSSETIEIGGMDNPIIKHPITKEPYIPGSSLKGKMRSLLELKHGFVEGNGEVHKYKGAGCKEEKCPICRIFGVSAGEGSTFGPGRLIVHDAKRKQVKEQLDLTQTEAKWENTINRITSTATPRSMERVPADAVFSFQINYRIFNVDDDNGEIDKELFAYVLQGMKLLQWDTLGGSGSRGYGKVEFENIKVTYLDGTSQEINMDDIPLQEIAL